MLFDLIELDLFSKKLIPIDLIDKRYIISRTQYYNLKKLKHGNKNVSRLSHKRLLELCEYLGVEVREILFDVNANKKNSTTPKQ